MSDFKLKFCIKDLDDFDLSDFEADFYDAWDLELYNKCPAMYLFLESKGVNQEVAEEASEKVRNYEQLMVKLCFKFIKKYIEETELKCKIQIK